MQSIAMLIVAYIPKLALAAAVFAAFWIGGKTVEKLVARVAAKDPLRADILALLGRAASVGLAGFGIVCALGTLGVDVTAIIAGLGLTGFALGFALKDMLSSAVAGVMLLMSRPFAPGDRVIVAGFEGAVVGVDLRYVTLDGGDKRYLVPNATVMTNPVTVLVKAAEAAE